MRATRGDSKSLAGSSAGSEMAPPPVDGLLRSKRFRIAQIEGDLSSD